MAEATKTPAEVRRDEAMDKVTGIDGWLTRSEAEALYGLAVRSTGHIVEIGSWKGRSTAALGLGSMAGKGHSVYAVDPFYQIADARKTSLGNLAPEVERTGPELLRRNLDAAGVNGAVKMVHYDSASGSQHVPDGIAVLFIDGDHSFQAVCRDLDVWLPKVADGGFVMMHDCTTTDPGVVEALDNRVLSRPQEFRLLDRIDSAIVFQKRRSIPRTVQLMCPGHTFSWGTTEAVAHASIGLHRVDLDNNGNGWDDFNAMWARALNRAEAGEISHAVMLHSDCKPQAGWLDILVDECEDKKADLVSVACAMKDLRGVMNCGLGTPSNRWGSFRRLTVRELVQKLPATFGCEDLKRLLDWRGADPKVHADAVLLHNTGCFVADLRPRMVDNVNANPFYKTDAQGRLTAWFDFPTDIVRDKDTGKWVNRRESEDWFFSRQLAQLGARTFITKKVRLRHQGIADFTNDTTWGEYEYDKDSAPQWEPKKEQ